MELREDDSKISVFVHGAETIFRNNFLKVVLTSVKISTMGLPFRQ